MPMGPKDLEKIKNMKTYGNLVVPDFFAGYTRMGKWNLVEGESLELLKKIEEQLCRLAPENEYGYRHLWIAVPRGDISRWCTRDEWDEENAGVPEEDRMDYEAQWKIDFPLEANWFEVEYAARYDDDKDFHDITIRNGREYCCAINNCDNGEPCRYDLKDFLEKLLTSIKELVDDICATPDRYNSYVESHLPGQYRYGRIARKDLDRIAPFCKLDIKEPELAKTVLRKIINKEFTPKKDFTIRDFLKYYHIAAMAFHNSLPEGFESLSKYDSADDIEFYLFNHGERFDGLDLDDPKDLDEIKYDHYGEIDLTRLNIHADNYNQDGTLVRVACSYASMIDDAVNVAVALYKAGAPLDMSWAEMMLAAVEGTDEVRIRPDTYHDYLGHDCDRCGGTIEIPFEYELEDSWWTADSLRGFMKYAKWDKLDEVKPL